MITITCRMAWMPVTVAGAAEGDEAAGVVEPGGAVEVGLVVGLIEHPPAAIATVTSRAHGRRVRGATKPVYGRRSFRCVLATDGPTRCCHSVAARASF
jgi:hypothetical protein